jgi:hypothetical protein
MELPEIIFFFLEIVLVFSAASRIRSSSLMRLFSNSINSRFLRSSSASNDDAAAVAGLTVS